MTETLWFGILIAVLAVLALLAIGIFGWKLARLRGLFRMLPDCADLVKKYPWTDLANKGTVLRYVSEMQAEHLQRRNEFWITYGQVVVAVLVIAILSILLLTKSISAEAGLPILSGVSGFAIAKGAASGRGTISGPGPDEG